MFLSELTRAVWTDEVSRAFGVIKSELERRGVRLGDFDVAMAAHAAALDAALVTDDVDHMTRVRGLRIVNWRVQGS